MRGSGDNMKKFNVSFQMTIQDDCIIKTPEEMLEKDQEDGNELGFEISNIKSELGGELYMGERPIFYFKEDKNKEFSVLDCKTLATWKKRQLNYGLEVYDYENSIVVQFSGGQGGSTRLIITWIAVDMSGDVWFNGVIKNKFNYNKLAEKINKVVENKTKRWAWL